MEDPLRNAHGSGRIEQHVLLGETPASELVSFSFHGIPMTGRSGEPLFAALLANGVRVLRTMPHTDEARGGFCLVGRCADCMLIVDGAPNVRACETPLHPDMGVETQRGLGHWATDPR